MTKKCPKNLIFLLFTINIFLTIFGFYSIYTSPYTGITCDVFDQRAYIKDIDKGSPAEKAGIRQGDVIIGINGVRISYSAFSVVPNYYINSRKELRYFWEVQKRLSETVAVGKPIGILLERDGKILNISLMPMSFPFVIEAKRLFPIYLVMWTFMFIPYLVIRKQVNEVTRVFFVWGTFSCMAILAAVFQERDLSYPHMSFRILYILHYAASFILSASLIHLSLIFPNKRDIVIKCPSILKILYGTAGFLFIIEVTGIIDNTYLTGYIPLMTSQILFPLITMTSFFTEKNPVYKKQVQWVVLGFTSFNIAWLTMISVPRILWGTTILPEKHPIFFFFGFLAPISLAFAVTRYRLMDIDDLIDSAVVYGFTLLILAGAEMLFLGSLSHIYGPALYGSPFAAVPAVLLIVFIYLPVRNAAKRTVEKIFKRGSYDIEEEVKRFILQAGICGDTPVLERFSTFVRDLLGPSGVCVIEKRSEPRLTFADCEKAMEAAKAIAAEPHRLCEYFKDNRRPAYGFGLTEKGILSVGAGFKPAPTLRTNLDSAIFVPVFVGNNCRSLIVLFEKWNKTAYSKKDRSLFESLAINIGHILETEEARRVQKEAEEEHLRQKEHVMKELHDGLGSILTNITVASQIANSSLERDGDKAKEMVGVISRCSVQAADFLRTGLTILDNQEGELGPVIKNMRHRLGGMLQECGMRVNFETGEDVEGMKTGAVTNLNMVRCVQEAFNNIMKHSGAKEVSVRFTRDNGNLIIEIEDDGKGFDLIQQRVQGYGLMNMAKRMEGLGGTLEKNSSPGKGTRLALTIPQKYPGTGMEMENEKG